MNNKLIDYDSHADSLYVCMRQSNYSVDIGDFVVDFDNKNFVCGIEIQNASKNIGLTKSQLSKILKAKFAINYRPRMVLIKLMLMAEQNPTIFSLPLMIDIEKNTEVKATITAHTT
jgi:uncharacterized protein YuzE